MGTRFRLFVQPPFGDANAVPETIIVSSPLGSVGPGPSDETMYVVEPIGKTLPYGLNQGPLGTPYLYLPPWPGPHLAPALPGIDGNFDHYEPYTAGFEAAHLFGCVRFTLDVWENYLGQHLAWHFQDDYERLELSILPTWDNAQFGYGFLEVGSEFADDSAVLPFSLDFDIIAHEVGHAIAYSVLGVPGFGTEYPEYVGFQEAFGDCVSLIAAMHFPSVIDSVLSETRGNLYVANRLERFSEFSPHTQIRSASNKRTMADFVHGWKNEHDLSEPLTGAIFDILVDIFHESLVRRRLISPALEALADVAEFDVDAEARVQAGFDRAYARDPEGFREALLDARDVVGTYLAETLWAISPDFLDYGDVAETMLAVDLAETGGSYGPFMRENFSRRYIGILHAPPRPDLPPDRKRITRLLLPQDRRLLPSMSYREAYSVSRLLQIQSQ